MSSATRRGARDELGRRTTSRLLTVPSRAGSIGAGSAGRAGAPAAGAAAFPLPGRWSLGRSAADEAGRPAPPQRCGGRGGGRGARDGARAAALQLAQELALVRFDDESQRGRGRSERDVRDLALTEFWTACDLLSALQGLATIQIVLSEARGPA